MDCLGSLCGTGFTCHIDCVNATTFWPKLVDKCGSVDKLSMDYWLRVKNWLVLFRTRTRLYQMLRVPRTWHQPFFFHFFSQPKLFLCTPCRQVGSCRIWINLIWTIDYLSRTDWNCSVGKPRHIRCSEFLPRTWHRPFLRKLFLCTVWRQVEPGRIWINLLRAIDYMSRTDWNCSVGEEPEGHIRC